MKTNTRWLICATLGVFLAPVLYVLVQGVWAFALGDIIERARAISENLGRYYLSLHSAIGAVIAAALVGFPLGAFGRVSPILLGSIVSGAVAAYLIIFTYNPGEYTTLIYLSKELPAFIISSMIFCVIGSKCIARSVDSAARYEMKK